MVSGTYKENLSSEEMQERVRIFFQRKLPDVFQQVNLLSDQACCELGEKGKLIRPEANLPALSGEPFYVMLRTGVLRRMRNSVWHEGTSISSIPPPFLPLYNSRTIVRSQVLF